ncbi:hypothetical protein [Nocardia tengchongensis]|uniref:hypothetical protein n=1 Tax=Nocardia tengchongensis TaxID=2055889 RepID=UPI00361C2149
MTSYLKDRRGSFVPVEEVGFTPSNPRHVEGAIELEINGVTILDKELWDDVDQLWAYIVTAICELRAKGEGSTSFPDQPIDLTFRRIEGGRVLVTLRSGTIGQRKATVDESELTTALQTAARAFLSRLIGLIPKNRLVYEATASDIQWD